MIKPNSLLTLAVVEGILAARLVFAPTRCNPKQLTFFETVSRTTDGRLWWATIDNGRYSWAHKNANSYTVKHRANMTFGHDRLRWARLSRCNMAAMTSTPTANGVCCSIAYQFLSGSDYLFNPQAHRCLETRVIAESGPLIQYAMVSKHMSELKRLVLQHFYREMSRFYQAAPVYLEDMDSAPVDTDQQLQTRS